MDLTEDHDHEDPWVHEYFTRLHYRILIHTYDSYRATSLGCMEGKPTSRTSAWHHTSLACWVCCPLRCLHSFLPSFFGCFEQYATFKIIITSADTVCVDPSTSKRSFFAKLASKTRHQTKTHPKGTLTARVWTCGVKEIASSKNSNDTFNVKVHFKCTDMS